MAFRMHTFTAHVRGANGHFEWFKTSSLHNLIALLGRYPASNSAGQIHAELGTISDAKKLKYKNAIDYLREEIPANQLVVSAQSLHVARGNMHAVVNRPAPRMRADVARRVDRNLGSRPVAERIRGFDQASRKNVVLSGHGCWSEHDPTGYPNVWLKKGQEIRFYCPHETPLGNDVGQRIDNHQHVAPSETIKGPEEIWDYTLQQKGSLRLLNRMQGTSGNQLVARFITVNSNTLLSQFINAPGNATAVFHWAACRVVFSKYGELWDRDANRWKTWDHGTNSWR